MLAGRRVADHLQNYRPEHAVLLAPALANEVPAALMSREMGWRLLKRECSEENGRLQSVV